MYVIVSFIGMLVSSMRDLKSHVHAWLKEWHTEAKSKDSKVQFNLLSALRAIETFNGPIANGREARQLKGIGDVLSKRIQKRIDSLYEDNRWEKPIVLERAPKAQKVYLPKYRSTAFAILLGMHSSNLNVFSKRDVSKEAQPYTDTNLDMNQKGQSNVTPNLKTLMDRQLIVGNGRPYKYSLTASGLVLAQSLHETQQRLTSTALENQETHVARVNMIDLSKEPSERLDERLGERQNQHRTASVVDNEHSVIDLVSSSDDGIPLSQQSITKDIRQDISSMSIHEIPVCKLSKYSIKLILDNRERLGDFKVDLLRQKLHPLDIQVERESLSVGDMIWVAQSMDGHDSVVLNHVVERKTIPDLIHAITNKRFYEQKERLSHLRMNVLYLLEESSFHMKDKEQFGEDALETATCALLDIGIIPVRTTGTTHTMDYLYKMSQLIKSKY